MVKTPHIVHTISERFTEPVETWKKKKDPWT